MEKEVEKYSWIIDEIIKYGMKIGIAIFIIVAGFWLGSWLKGVIRKRMIKRNLDPSIREFALPVIDVVFKILVLLTAVNTVGIEITSFAAIMAGLAAGVGLSLQGSLSNLAGGLLIIMFKPFKVGDFIEALGNSGTVESISILYTTIVTVNQQVVILPNSSLLNNPIMNYSVKPTRRLDIKIGISYSDDVEKTQKILKDMLENDPYIIKDQPITVEVLEFADSSVNLAVRAFVKREDYWDAYFKLYKQTKTVLDKNGISIPFPQTEMRIIQPTNESPQ
ncbi:mechanosensitive ion channel family protein [Moheibacter lacus]|uniref:Mechanosensitive ion channel n=1 Tax=Moheibacter lacus TaxID=2745851 RepID=A0A838ZH24_9FLAO|nr:mechanosensitive ion channel domain-containing protein [Moheibacter lacus]MBA5628981.1 mechanosensitive ion channel [Moheibacter lacus]